MGISSLPALSILSEESRSRSADRRAATAGLPYEEALGRFYDSKTFDLVGNGIADMHCRSDEYLAEELLIGYGCISEEGCWLTLLGGRLSEKKAKAA